MGLALSCPVQCIAAITSQVIAHSTSIVDIATKSCDEITTMANTPSTQASNFQAICKQWRQTRKLSQLDLALAANVSQRHVSWLETGRSMPSRDMVIRLSEAMDIPLRERNLLFQAAGYASNYRETDLAEPVMQPVRDALQHVLSHHQPLPAIVVDRYWNVKMKNPAADMLLGFAQGIDAIMKDVSQNQEINLALLTLHPQGLRQYMTNWDQAAPAFLRRLHNEALASGDKALQDRFSEMADLAGDITPANDTPGHLLPVLPLELTLGDTSLSLFSVISTFGTPQDITTDELRIEAFYPTDKETASFFEALHTPDITG
ncbi:MAG: helix-turn-helix domain-containing protein [Halioglobus sp.]